ncbi:MAG: hypothetical protein ACRDRF_24095, partial [Pseudonocardiaceae bacterium]
KRWIGGWKTLQRRSYFAIRLPHRWWLWGIDIQFGSYIDEAQLRYFAGVALDQVQPGDRIILCMAKEVESGRKGTEVHSDRDVEFLEREIIQPCGAQLVLSLKSGKHYYARYEHEDGVRQHIASGGGAFLHPTTTFPSAWTFRARRVPSLIARPAPIRHRRCRNGCGSGSGCSRRTTFTFPGCSAPLKCCWRRCWDCISETVTSHAAPVTFFTPCGRARRSSFSPCS